MIFEDQEATRADGNVTVTTARSERSGRGTGGARRGAAEALAALAHDAVRGAGSGEQQACEWGAVVT